MTVRASRTSMRVEVSDRGAGFDPAALHAPSAEHGGGWGVPIVATLAHRWGVERQSETTTVWFEIDRPARDTPLDPELSPPQ